MYRRDALRPSSLSITTSATTTSAPKSQNLTAVRGADATDGMVGIAGTLRSLPGGQNTALGVGLRCLGQDFTEQSSLLGLVQEPPWQVLMVAVFAGC